MRTDRTINPEINHRLIDGAVLLDKPEGISSFKSMSEIKRKLGTKKVGHTGTLDPFASGLLILLTGKMTKIAPFFSEMDKSYTAEFTFGKETDTLDTEGEVIAEAAVPSKNTVINNRERFIGEIRQRPPLFSAVHINGKRAYDIARNNKSVEMPERTVRIDNIQIKGFQSPVLSLDISCSKGTYIRSLARDWGIACESRCFVSKLKRTSVGNFKLSQAVTPENFDPQKDLISPFDLIAGLSGIDILTIDDSKTLEALETGKQSALSQIPEETNGTHLALFTPEKRLIALLLKKENKWAYQFVV